MKKPKRKAKFRKGSLVAVIDEPGAAFRYSTVQKIYWYQCDDVSHFDGDCSGWWYKLDGRRTEYSEVNLRPLTAREVGPGWRRKWSGN